MISACALVACADTPSVQGTPKTTPLDWFDVMTAATNHGALAIADGSDALCEVVGGKFEIDSDIDNLVTFTATDSLTQQMAKVTFNLDAAVVPNGALQQLTEGNKPKVAFALYQSEQDGTTTNFMAWVGSEWIPLTGATPNEGAPYTLVMDFDNQVASASKVRFSVTVGQNTAVLTTTTATDGWIPYTTTVTGKVKVNFVGCGKVASFVGKQLEVVGEIIVIGGKGKVDINNETKSAFEKAIENTGYGTVDAFLAADASTAFSETSFQEGLKVAEAYALGLVVKNGNEMVAKDSGKLKVVANAQASTTDGIPVNLNIAPPTDSGATITYILKGSVTGASGSYEDIVSDTDKAKLVIPTDKIDGTKKSYRFFKVITNVKLKDAQ